MNHFISKRKIIAIAMCFVMLFGIVDWSQTVVRAAARYESSNTIEKDTEYALVMSSITPTGMSSGLYMLQNNSSEIGVMNYKSFLESETVSTNESLWKFESTNNGYSLRASGITDDSKAYLNVNSSGASMGAKQELKVTASGSSFTILGADSCYLRFTNSGGASGKTSGFTGGTKTSSNTWKLYKVTDSYSPEPTTVAGATKEPALATSTPVATTSPKPTQVPNDDNNEYTSTYIEETGEIPAYTIGCMTDLHIDYGIQNFDEPIRPSTVKAAEMIKKNENVDLMICGGDVTSNNAWAGWTKEKYDKSLGLIRNTLNMASMTGKTLYVSGNHEFVAGGSSWNSGDYSQFMNEDIGELDSSEYLSQDDDSDDAVAALTRDNVNISMTLAYHYIVGGIDFIGINTPYSGGDNHGEYVYTDSTIEWVQNKLEELGNERLVFVVSHYPLKDARNVKKYMAEPYNTNLKNALLPYENVVLLYGHDHGAAYIDKDTYERVTPYSSDGSIRNDRPESNDSFVSSFMGSMGYYSNLYNPSLLDYDPMVVQALMIYVYSDRITFQMKNYGEVTGTSKAPLSYTIMKNTGLTPKLLATPTPAPVITTEPVATTEPSATLLPTVTFAPTATSVPTVTQASVTTPGEKDSTMSGSKTTVLSKPTGLRVVKIGKKKVKLTWKKVAKASGYKIYRSDKKNKSGKCIATIKGNKKLQFVDKKIKLKKTYYYSIKAFTTEAGKKIYSKFSKIRIKK